MTLPKTVRALIGRSTYEARMADGKVVQLHRVSQVAGGHSVGGTIDYWTSIGPKHPKRAEIIAHFEQME